MAAEPDNITTPPPAVAAAPAPAAAPRRTGCAGTFCSASQLWR